MDQARLRSAIVEGGVRLGARGLVVAAEGNLSVRVDDGLLITPAGRRKDALAPEEVLLAGLEPGGGDGAADGLRPSSDIAIHRAIYRARPDIRAVVHAHVPAAMALTAAGERPDPGLLPETAHHLPVLPFVPFAPMGSAELAGLVAAALRDGAPAGAVVLERHGAVAVGGGEPLEALGQALDRMELVDVLCRVTRDALLLRSARRAGA